MLFKLPPLPQSRFARLAEIAAWAAVPVSIGAVLVTRAEQVPPLYGIGILALGAILAVMALSFVAVAAIEIWKRGAIGMSRLFRATLVSGAVLAYPAYLAAESLRLPAITDISTDLDDPPVFSTARTTLAQRGARPPSDIDRRRRAVQEHAYPAIRTLVIESEPEEAFQSVIRAVRFLKWRVIEEVRPEDRRGLGRIEAIDETRLMRFKDDVTIRLRWAGGVTRVDIRSASRFGRHDFGRNAERIARLVREVSTPSE